MWPQVCTKEKGLDQSREPGRTCSSTCLSCYLCILALFVVEIRWRRKKKRERKKRKYKEEKEEKKRRRREKEEEEGGRILLINSSIPSSEIVKPLSRGGHL